MSLRYVALFLFFSIFASAQKLEFAAVLIPDTLKQNANAVIRMDQLEIVVNSQRSMTIDQRTIITVLNEAGAGAADFRENYDKKTSILNIEATVYDAVGKEIKKLKRRDFRDQASVDGATMFSDNRFLYMDFTPTQYPFTIVYESSIETSNTAFIPQWYPLLGYFVSVEKSVLNVTFPPSLGFRKKEFNFDGFEITKTSDSPTQVSYTASRIPAQRSEHLSPSYTNIFPHVMMGLEAFHLEGVDGKASTWEEFGKWYSDKILSGMTELPEETKIKIKALVGTETDPIKKAQIIYDFVQQKSRYVSIQVGIGGWKPMPASDVDRLGYGDCKALTNYTKALLDEVGVPSYHTIIYGSGSKMDIQSDFVSMQGNHMILSIPDGDKYIWLECTSQEDPFGYQGRFTDDRDALVIRPEGAQIIRTSNYLDNANSQISKGSYALDANGDLSGTIAITSNGTQYNQKFRIESLQPFQKEAHYKDYWSNINNLKLSKLGFVNDKGKISFTENIDIAATSYATFSGNRMLFVINAYNQLSGNNKKIRNRKTPFEIQRGYFDDDEIEILLPDGYSVEAMPNEFKSETKFGTYSTSIIKQGENKLLYKRKILINTGTYPSSEYEEYRLFLEKIAKNDNAKVILIKNQ